MLDPLFAAIISGLVLIIGALVFALVLIIRAKGASVAADITSDTTRKLTEAGKEAFLLATAAKADKNSDALLAATIRELEVSKQNMGLQVLLARANKQLEVNNQQNTEIIHHLEIAAKPHDTTQADANHLENQAIDADAKR